MIDMLVYLAVLAIFVIVAWWLLAQMVLPDPIKQVLLIAIVVMVVVVLITVMIDITGPNFPLRFW